MSLINRFFRSKQTDSTASIAKERLQILISNESNSKRITPEVLKEIEMGILKLFNKHMKINKDAVDMKVVNHKGKQLVELNIKIPD